MTKNIIHIGYQKTGSSWFQKYYYPNVINYANIDRKTIKQAFLWDSALRFDYNKAKNILPKTKKPLILCEEELFGNIHSGGHFGSQTKDIAYRLHQTLPDSKIVIFIRNQIEMISSIYKQYIKEGGTHSSKRYLFPNNYLKQGFEPRSVPLFSFDHLDYYLTINHYINLFGKDNVYIFLYEDFKSDNLNFIDKYKDLFNFQYNSNKINFTKYNTAYRRHIIHLAKFINHFTYRDIIDKKYIINIPSIYKKAHRKLSELNKYKIFGKTPSTTEILDKKIIHFIKDYYKDSNQKLVDKFELPLDKYNYPL